EGRGRAGVGEAGMSNLVIFCNSLEQAIVVNEQVPAISAVHPARTLLLVGEPGADRDLTARVTVRPIAAGGKSYTCAEQVTLHAGGSAGDRVPVAVRALLIGGLPGKPGWGAAPPPPPAGAVALGVCGDAAPRRDR